jgi:GAF domain-containing protein
LRGESYGYSREFIEQLRALPVEPGRGTTMGRVLLEGKVVHIEDVVTDPDYVLRDAQKLGGYRTMLGVPMLREGVPIGVLSILTVASPGYIPSAPFYREGCRTARPCEHRAAPAC